MGDPAIVFAGTPDFALASLKALVSSGNTPVAVLTQPDRPAGRGKRMTASPVKTYAGAAGIRVLQAATLKDDAALDELRDLRPDLLVVAAYGLILPQAALDIPRVGCLNVHASLLPRWRGAAPIQAAILAGDRETGVCLMGMTAGLDNGPVYASHALAIGEHETAGELHDRLAAAGGELLARHLDDILEQRLPAVAQDEALASYAPKIRNADAELHWSEDAARLDRQVRAYNPVPGAWFMLGDQRIKCWRSGIVDDLQGAAGTVLAANRDGIVVACGRGALRLTSLQRPGRKAITAAEFAAQLDLDGSRL